MTMNGGRASSRSDLAWTLANGMGIAIRKAERLARHAINRSLCDGGEAILNPKNGFVLANSATPAERDLTAKYYASYARAFARKAKLVRGQDVPADPKQLKLFDENGEEI
jgi:hypothetical protein